MDKIEERSFRKFSKQANVEAQRGKATKRYARNVQSRRSWRAKKKCRPNKKCSNIHPIRANGGNKSLEEAGRYWRPRYMQSIWNPKNNTPISTSRT